MGTQIPPRPDSSNQNHTLTETVNLRIGIVPVFENIPSTYQILVDNVVLFETDNTMISGSVQHHDLCVPLTPGSHDLNIRFLPTGQQFENIQVVGLEFNTLKLRDIDLYLMSEYLLDQPRLVDGLMTHKIDQCTVLGWAGTYRFGFSTPIMPWMIRNL